MFSTSAFAVLATDVFPSGVSVGFNSSDTDNIKCIDDDGKTTDCQVIGAVRELAPYTDIDGQWPTFTSAPDVTVLSGEIKTINPGVYNSIQVDVSKWDHGVLIMNPGVYWINEYSVSGQVLPGDANGTDPDGSITLFVKSKLNFIGSHNNCIVADGKIKRGPYTHPNRYILYTEDTAPIVEDTCMSGYIYFRNELNDAEIDLWGAISAETITLKKGTKSSVYVDLDHLIFTDFNGLLEVGPSMKAGWHMVKAPAEVDVNNPVTVESFFGDDLDSSTFRTDWRVYQRDYNGSVSYYTELTELTTPLEKNRGYWLGTDKDVDLKVLGLNPVVWDRKINGCTSNKGCYRYALQSCTAGDTNPTLYNLVGSVGSTMSDWADYRVEVDGTVMTPSEAHTANIMSNQIWKYSPSASGTYVTADDSGLLGDSTIDYFDGFWVEMNCTSSIGKTINLIVPNRK